MRKKAALFVILLLLLGGGIWWAGLNTIRFVPSEQLPVGSRLLILNVGDASLSPGTFEIHAGKTDLGWGFAHKGKVITYQLNATGEIVQSGHFTISRFGPTTLQLANN